MVDEESKISDQFQQLSISYPFVLRSSFHFQTEIVFSCLKRYVFYTRLKVPAF